MRSLAVLMASFAAPALAHDGAHLHPHGIDATVWLVIGAAALVAGLIYHNRGD